MSRDGDEIDGGGENDDKGKKANTFLKDFLLNRRWVDNVKYDDAKEYDGHGEKVIRLKGSSDLHSDSEDSVERMDAFESKYVESVGPGHFHIHIQFHAHPHRRFQ